MEVKTITCQIKQYNIYVKDEKEYKNLLDLMNDFSVAPVVKLNKDYYQGKSIERISILDVRDEDTENDEKEQGWIEYHEKA